MERSTFLRTAAFVIIATCAAIGLAALLAGPLSVTPFLIVPIGAVGLTMLLTRVERAAVQRGYHEGVANALVDPGTRLPAPAAAHQMLALEFAAAERGRPLTLVLFSLDNFSRLSVLDGGAAGVRLLIGAGAIFRRRTRGMNLSARLDDRGTFLSILGGVDTKGARTFVSRVRKDLATLNAGGQAVTVSASVCSYQPTMHTPDEMLAEALGALALARTSDDALVVAGEDDSIADNAGYAIILSS